MESHEPSTQPGEPASRGPAPPTTPPMPGPLLNFKDRSTGLVVCGILLIVGGMGAGCLSMAAPAAALMPKVTSGGIVPPAEAQIANAAATALLYLLIGGGLVAVGIGAIRARRWVQPVLLSLAWVWLIGGVVSLGLLIIAMPPMLHASMPRGMTDSSLVVNIVIVVMLLFTATFYIVLPGLLIWFIRSEDVRKTCEHRNPSLCWTDRCPRRTLGLSIALGMLAPATLTALAYSRIPVFHLLIPRPGAVVVVLGTAAAMAVLAVQIARLKPSGWWGIMAMTGLMTISSLVSLRTFTVIDIYEALGMTEEHTAFLSDATVELNLRAACMVMVSLLCVGTVWYLLVIRPDFTVSRRSAPKRDDH